MSGFSDYTTLLPRKEDGSAGWVWVGPHSSPLRNIKSFLFLSFILISSGSLGCSLKNSNKTLQRRLKYVQFIEVLSHFQRITV